MLHVERLCIRTYTLYVVLCLLSCSASNNLYYRRAERAPHLSYSGEKSSSYIYIYIYIYNYICFLYIYIYIYIRSTVRRARAVNALRANVGLAG